MAKRKCAICGEWIEDNSESVPYKKRYAHLKCFNVAMQVVITEKSKKKTTSTKPRMEKAIPQREVKAGLSEEEYQEKKQLCDYIREYLKSDIPIKVYKLIEDYMKKYKVSYHEIYKTLHWFYSIENNPVKGDMIGIFPYIYDEAKKRLEVIENAQKDCAEKVGDIQEMYQAKVLTAPDIKDRVIKQIDISKIGE